MCVCVLEITKCMCDVCVFYLKAFGEVSFENVYFRSLNFHS